MDIRKVVGINVRKARLRQGLTQEALAGRDMDTAHVSRIERGVENPTVLVLEKLAKALGMNAGEFFRPVRGPAVLPPNLRAGRKSKK